MSFFRATIEVMGEAGSEAEFCDLISALLTENGVYGSDDILKDWAYSMLPKEIDVPKELRGPEEYFADGDVNKGKDDPV